MKLHPKDSLSKIYRTYITPGLERTSQPGLTSANSTNASQNVHSSKNAPKTAVHQFPWFTWHPLLSIVPRRLQETLHDGPPSVSCDCFYFVCACSGSHIRNTIVAISIHARSLMLSITYCLSSAQEMVFIFCLGPKLWIYPVVWVYWEKCMKKQLAASFSFLLIFASGIGSQVLFDNEN